MEEMTLERLKAFEGIQKEVDEIQRELDLLYFPITSPNGRAGEGYNSTPGDPTASAVQRIMRLEGKLIRRRDRLANELEAIENWLETLPDHELCAIIRAHYLLGDSWERCTQRILSYDNSDTAKLRVYRFFGRIK
jgi:hypothetical protein